MYVWYGLNVVIGWYCWCYLRGRILRQSLQPKIQNQPMFLDVHFGGPCRGIGYWGKTNHYISGRLAEAFECSASGRQDMAVDIKCGKSHGLYGTIPNDRDVFSWNTVMAARYQAYFLRTGSLCRVLRYPALRRERLGVATCARASWSLSLRVFCHWDCRCWLKGIPHGAATGAQPHS